MGSEGDAVSWGAPQWGSVETGSVETGSVETGSVETGNDETNVPGAKAGRAIGGLLAGVAERSRRPAGSDELEDDDAPVGVVFFVLGVCPGIAGGLGVSPRITRRVGLRGTSRRVAVDRKLQPGLVLVALAPLALFLLALPDLLDDERR
jgi:hypothetical protein